MGINGSGMCEKHPDQEAMFICLSENPPRPICMKCRSEKAHYKHEIRSTKNLAVELMEKCNGLPEEAQMQYKKATDQPKSSKSYEQFVDEGSKIINGIFDKIYKELETVRQECIKSFVTHMKNSFESISIKPVNDSSLPVSLQKLLDEVKFFNKSLNDLYSQSQYIEICRHQPRYTDMKSKIENLILTMQNDYLIRSKLETYQIFFEQGEFLNKFRRLVQTHVKFYYTGDKRNDEIVAVRVNRLNTLVADKKLLKFYDIHSRGWSEVNLKDAELMPDIGMQVAETKDNKVYIIGGKRKSEFLSSLYLFNEAKGSLTKLSSMALERSNHGATANGISELYVVGGENSSGNLAHCEVYKIATDKWESLPDLKAKREFVSCCCLGQNLLYAIGGFNDEYLNTIEQLNISQLEKGWRNIIIPDLAKDFPKRINCGVIPLSETQILIFGGFNDYDMKDSYIYKTDQGKIARCEDLKHPEKFEMFSYDINDKYVYCLARNTVHVFDMVSKKWATHSSEKSILNL